MSQAPLDPGKRSDLRRHVRRAETSEIVSRVARGSNVLVVGARGSGKTTVLRYAAEQLRDDEHLVAYVGAGNGKATAVEVLQLACLDLSTQLADQEAAQRLRDALAMPLVSPDANIRAVELVRVLQRAVPQRSVLVLDEVMAATAQSLFGRLRDDLWAMEARWIVSAVDRDAAAILAPPADAFFDSVVELAPLTTEQRLDLIRGAAPELPEPETVASLADTPRALLEIVRALERDPHRAAGIAEEARLRGARLEKASGLGPSAVSLMRALEERPLSASDERIRTQFGWSRQRAAQVLNGLLDAGLVRSRMEPSPSGAMRKVYEVVT